MKRNRPSNRLESARATQLRLVEGVPVRRSRSTRASVGAARRAFRSAGRPASWGEWQLDSRTRDVGRAGVVAARRELERALEGGNRLPRAS